jgi:hypothetical protein
MAIWDHFESLILEYMETRVFRTTRSRRRDFAESNRERARNGGLGSRAGSCPISGGEWCPETGENGSKSLNLG